VQLSKTVYFPDHPLAPRSGLTVPFGRDQELFDAVAPLSSYTIRQLLGTDSYADVVAAADKAELPTSLFVRTRLSESICVKPAASGLQATFSGGKGSPLHEWFPYLEGYSPDFVKSILRTYAPDAGVILDPFCGSGTTALVGAALGLDAYYCEVNPVCRAIIDSKVIAQSLSKNERAAAAETLHQIADGLEAKLDRVPPAKDLSETALQIFGKRAFFSAANWEEALRLRSVLDLMHREQPRLAQLFAVAVLRSLVPASNLIRRGDLRFRNAREVREPIPALRNEVRNSLHMMASDLADIGPQRGSVALLCENARQIGDALGIAPDIIVTSPPYLNGTNYFRNTKIELWFLRCLGTRSDLRRYRDEAITAGINDVTAAKVGADAALGASAKLRRVLEELIDDAYDLRIPMMAAAYFNEMSKVIRNFRAISGSSSRVAIDLGDSCYGSVWIPTDRIIGEMMVDAGFHPVDEVILRERQSRNGRKLRQTLQVFEVLDAKPRVYPSACPRQLAAWRAFASGLPHQRGEFAKRNWGHPWHSMCSYQGKLKPSIAHHLVGALMPVTGGRILDPFSGVGTIPFEARLAGHTTFAFDISPAALEISRGKLLKTGAGEVWAEVRALERWIDLHRTVAIDHEAIGFARFNGSLASYFHPETLAEILAARAYFLQPMEKSGARSLVLAALLHILHGNRPYALSRRSHPITPFAPTGAIEYRSLVPRLTNKIRRLLEAAPDASAPAGFVYDQDATAQWPEAVSELDAIITSPPFYDSTRFYAANWMRLWFCGWGAQQFRQEPRRFVEERQKETFAVYEPVLEQAASRLKAGGYLALHLGKSSKCDMASELALIGRRYLQVVDVLDESVGHCESHGIRDKGTVTHHQYVIFRRN